MYWVIVGLLFAFGVVAIFSIGAPFLLLSLTLLALGPFRGQPKTFWPPTAAIVGGIAGFVLTAPLSCTASATLRAGESTILSTTVCRSLLGFTFSGPAIGNPSFIPAVIVAVVAAVTAGFAASFLVARLSGRRQSRPGETPHDGLARET